MSRSVCSEGGRGAELLSPCYRAPPLAVLHPEGQKDMSHLNCFLMNRVDEGPDVWDVRWSLAEAGGSGTSALLEPPQPGQNTEH